ncbi:hypothetical protein A1F94_006330 [Pyrenophora tritici-repentis]|nr:hypothetical protein A1F94_006330 [Pyrenophora tritici-repentis]
MPDLEQKWEPIDKDNGIEDTKGFWLFTSEKRKSAD